ncbi:nuclear factor 7, brain-like [Oreochromis niloticus]|uniref:nuclear factor 7, brain-like n=1 Tax=Oreochromis niloticus TaxID=8128 RepID=UPI00022B121A|nr:nuclear factor 7, brain-like [Oreochromis niloticus]
MAEKPTFIKSHLSCHLCSETFKDPVTLTCNHSFCSSCLKTFWEQNKKKNCPRCKQKILKKCPGINFPLKELADSFAERQKAWAVCNKHQKEPQLFCVDEDKPLCPVCDFPHQQSHKVIPVEAAIDVLKEQLKSDLKSLQDERDKYKQMEEKYNEMREHIEKQLLSTERQIRAEFNKLQQFLKEEEESRLAALREEEEQKGRTISREMKMIEEQISSLSDSISAVEEELQKDSVPFLSSYKDTQSRARAQSSVSDPQLVSGALIDVAKHLGNLSFRVWEKMKDKVHFSPVILDPNTASPYLYLSDDLTSVRRQDTKQQLPDNPERYIKHTNVLGSEGFSSGKHSWEVEVGDHPRWNLGLVRESVGRKGEHSASSKYPIWCLFYDSGKYIIVVGQTVKVKKSLQRIRVQLDYDRGEVSFYDPKDMTHIYTYRDIFTDKLFPFFSIGEAGDAKTSDIKICQTVI